MNKGGWKSMKSKILKKLCSGLLALSMLTSPGIGQSVGELVGTSITVNAVDVLTYGDYNYTVNSDNTVTITKYIGTNITAIIPNSIDSKTVKSITKDNNEIFRGIIKKLSNKNIRVKIWIDNKYTGEDHFHGVFVVEKVE